MIEEPVRGGFAIPELRALSGREQMERSIAGDFVPPPVHYLTGMRPSATGDGTSEFTMPASGWLASAVGPIPGGMLAVLADGPLGAAIQTRLPPRVHYTTAELSISYLRPAQPDGRLLTSRGTVIHAGRSLALSDAVVQDADGRLLAHCTSRCFVFPPAPADSVPPAPPAGSQAELPAYDTPDPWQRPVTADPLDLDLVEKLSGLEQWRAWVAGDLPKPPIALLTGAYPTHVEPGRVDFAMPATGWHCSPTGFVLGGFLAYLADCALAGTAGTLAEAGTAYVPVDLTVKFLRPVLPDGRELVARGRVVHAGRTLVVCAAEVVNADGKPVVTAIGSTMLLPGGVRTMRQVAVEDQPAAQG